MWLKEKVISVDKMRASRRGELKRHRVFENLDNQVAHSFTGDTSDSVL